MCGWRYGPDDQLVQEIVGLDGDSYATTATPEPDEKVGRKAGCRNIGSQLEGVPEQIVRGDECLGHFFSCVLR